MTADKAPQWNYAPLGERLTETAISVGTIGLYGLALTQIFNPAALGVAATYAVGRTAYAMLSSRGEKAVQKGLKDGYFAPLPPRHAELQTLVDEMTTATGMPRHSALLATDKIGRMATPWYLRWLLMIPDVKKTLMQGTAATIPAMDVVMASDEFLKKWSPAEVRFVIAHEIGHAKVEDSYAAKNFAKLLKKHTQMALVVGMGAVLAGGILGVGGMPALFAGGFGLLTGGLAYGAVAVAANLGINYACRIVERRADRNAIYLTRDLEPAISFLREASTVKGKAPRELPAWREVSSHPSYHPRVANLRAAFEAVAAYAPPATAAKAAIDAYKSQKTLGNTGVSP